MNLKAIGIHHPQELPSYPPYLGMRAGAWYTTPFSGRQNISGQLAGGSFWVPFPVWSRFVADRIGVRVMANPAAQRVGRLGIYRDTGAKYPGALLLDAGQINVPNAGNPADYSLVISPELDKGVLYWLCMSMDGALSLPYDGNTPNWWGSSDMDWASNQAVHYWDGNDRTAGLPDPAPAGLGTSNILWLLGVRVQAGSVVD